eukprot:gnl/MRDRNA2_/MRDRNA2_111272_c0_seq1.p1 gnl/MRDRNA2_/MRDRNA2_111272_c0~~gnl/MRDRNA2_/MRDRNA2_111272_c0_seq1.p1  ORF type:complete len:810 (-),score=177.66 gnl/MRDRNA2_/MRDRNA2_111272_c0_seq1:69-2498(-)
MGSAAGKLQRYKAAPEKESREPDHSAWRQPKQKNLDGRSASKSDVNNAFPVTKSSSSSAAPTPASAAAPSAAAIKLGGGDTRGSLKTGLKPTRAPTLEEDDDMQEEGCSNLAAEADKVWEQLMSQKQKTNTTDFSSLFSLGELKDEIEKAAKRADTLSRAAAGATANAVAARNELNDLCVKIESRNAPYASSKSTTNWRLGDLAIRRGKGACEVSTIHQEEIPPYYEVRMIGTGSIVGTEGTNLISLSAPQQAQIREAIRNLEDKERKCKLAQEAADAANDEVQQQHSFLSQQVEKMLSKNNETQQSTGTFASSGNSMPGPGLGPGPGPGSGFDPSKPPPGMPDLNKVKRWTGAQENSAKEQQKEESYPSVSGVKEVVGSLPTQVGGGPAPTSYESSSNGKMPEAESVGSTAPSSSPDTGPRRNAPPGVPQGFPSFDKIRTPEPAPAPAPAPAPSSYPAAHVSRETFSRPDPEPSSGGGSASIPQTEYETHGARASQQTNTAYQEPPRTNTTPRETNSTPFGFPSFEKMKSQQQQQQQQAEETQLVEIMQIMQHMVPQVAGLALEQQQQMAQQIRMQIQGLPLDQQQQMMTQIMEQFVQHLGLQTMQSFQQQATGAAAIAHAALVDPAVFVQHQDTLANHERRHLGNWRQKIQMCKFFLKGRCSNPDNCAYSHTEDEMKLHREMYDIEQGLKAVNKKPVQNKVAMCRYHLKGMCKDDSATCKFAHDESELVSPVGKPKTLLCKFHMQGKCLNGTACGFAHSEEELISGHAVAQQMIQTERVLSSPTVVGEQKGMPAFMKQTPKPRPILH